jgi:hypothetical protein
LRRTSSGARERQRKGPLPRSNAHVRAILLTFSLMLDFYLNKDARTRQIAVVELPG